MRFSPLALAVLALLAPALAGADVPAPQVLIEARIVETTGSFTKGIGVDWTTPRLDAPRAGVLTSLPNLGDSFRDGNALDVDAIVRAIAADANSRVIAEPRVTSVDGRAANIQIGDDLGVDFPEAFRPFGIDLQFTPVITPDGQIRMDIKIDTSALEGGEPELTRRQTNTQVLVHDGQTTVLGGLLDRDTLESGSKLPVLTHVPLLGELFRSAQQDASKKELLIFVTPRILGEDGKPVGGGTVAPAPKGEPSHAVNWPVQDTAAGDLYVGLGVAGTWQFNPDTNYGLTFADNTPYLGFDNTVASADGKVVIGWVPTDSLRVELDLSGGGGTDTDRGADTNQFGDLFRIDGQNFSAVNQTILNQQRVETHEFDSTLRLQTLHSHGDHSDLLFTTGLGYRYRGIDTHFSNDISGGGPFFQNLLDVEVREHAFSAVLGATYLHACGPHWGWQVGVESQLGVGVQEFDAHQYGGGITNGTRVDGQSTAFLHDTKLQLGLFRNLNSGKRLQLGVDVGGRRVPTIRDARIGMPLDIGYDTQPYTGVSLTFFWNPCATCGRGAVPLD